MSQQSETEDRCESPPAPTRCSANCGFYANPECGGMCSICFKASLSKQKTSAPPPVVESTEALKPSPTLPVSIPPSTETPHPAENGVSAAVASPAKRARPIRCTTCDKRVGLMGFSCRCGGVFCQKHRYPKEHQCPFDRKAAEKVKLTEENPVILSDKIERV